MKILCLLVRHGLERYPNALADLDAWYTRQGLLDNRLLWIIDNSLPHETPPKEIAPAVILRPGDNSAWEFSAWASAINDARRIQGIDVVHFVTSAFNTLYTRYLEHFRPEMLCFVMSSRVCLGHIDSYPQPVSIRGIESSSWIRTCFFFLNSELALHPRSWVAFANQAEIFEPGDSRTFRQTAPISTDYQKHITEWLEGQEKGGHRWHSSVGLGAGESERFRKKTLAILNEHQLAIQFREEGIALADFCWLWSAATRTDQSWENPPRESQQLRLRRSYLGIPE